MCGLNFFLLFIVLLIAGILLLLNFKFYGDETKPFKNIPLYISTTIGSILGLVSGIVSTDGNQTIDGEVFEGKGMVTIS